MDAPSKEQLEDLAANYRDDPKILRLIEYVRYLDKMLHLKTRVYSASLDIMEDNLSAIEADYIEEVQVSAEIEQENHALVDRNAEMQIKNRLLNAEMDFLYYRSNRIKS